MTMRTCPKCSAEWARRGPYVASVERNVPRSRVREVVKEKHQPPRTDDRRDSIRSRSNNRYEDSDSHSSSCEAHRTPRSCIHGRLGCATHPRGTVPSRPAQYHPPPPRCEACARTPIQRPRSPTPPSCDQPVCFWY